MFALLDHPVVPVVPNACFEVAEQAPEVARGTPREPDGRDDAEEERDHQARDEELDRPRMDAPVEDLRADRHQDERAAAIQADPDGTGFIFQMFRYELANHEYSYTGDLAETLDALGITTDEVNASPALLNGLHLAAKACMAEDE